VRAEFGRQPRFTDIPAQIMDQNDVSEEFDEAYCLRNPTVTEFDTTPHMSESEANTDRLVTKSSSMRHQEGGWPKDVDFTIDSDVSRFRKKAEKDEEYKNAVKTLGPLIGRCMKQNNTINIYENYFDGVQADHSSEPPSAKGLAVFRDPNEIKRTATSINWHPEGPTTNGKIAVSYSILNFQDPKFSNAQLPVSSYIWDIMNPNTPDVELIPPSPLCCLRFNPKSSETLVGGSYNGLVTYYDLRKPFVDKKCLPLMQSVIEKSHHDPVYDVFWISSKTGNQCASVSTDGQMMWWDTRHLGEPTDTLELATDAKGGGMTLGGSSMEYNTEAGPTKYLVGTEQGIVLSINLRNKKTNNGLSVFDNGAGKHHGPIYSIQRNPTHNKFFMTVGDWTARIWVEDVKTPIMTTKYHSSYLTSGCWSPTRAGVFYVTRMDGVVDIWDYFYRQNEVAYSHKVGDAALSTISVQGTTQGGGRLVAVGDVNGTVSLLEVCDSLAVQQQNEKTAINGMFERETKQEKNLETRERDHRRAKQAEEEASKKDAAEKKDGKDERMEELLRKVDADFLAMIKEAEDDESKANESGEIGNDEKAV
jgi:dynein intermediate chain 2